MTLTGHLIVFGLLIVGPLLIASGVLAYRFESVERTNLQAEAKRVSGQLASVIDREIGTIQSALTALSISHSLEIQDLELFNAKARIVAKTIPGSLIALRKPDGQVVVNTEVPIGNALPKVTEPALLEADRLALTTGQTVVSNEYQGIVRHEPHVSVETAVSVGGAPAVLSIAVAADTFRKLLLTTSAPRTWLIALVDANHRIITRTRNEEDYAGASVSPRLAAALTTEEGVLPNSATREGTPVYTVFCRVPGADWYVVSSIPIANLEYPLHQVWLFIGTLAALGLLISIGSATVYGRRLAGSVSNLDQAADAIGKSHAVAVTSTGVTEFDKLGDTLAHASRDLQTLSMQRAELYSRLLNARESERQRLSRELHDQTGQNLVAALLEIKRTEASGGEQQRESFVRLRALIDRIGQDVHRVALELRPPSISEIGLVGALSNLVKDWNEQNGTQADLYYEVENLENLADELRVTIYRVVQEALTNVAKHAGKATQVTITLSHVGSILRLVIEDDGQGFDTEGNGSASEGQVNGLGLVGMRERLSSVGGEMEIESVAGKGTTIFVRLPFVAAKDTSRTREAHV